jgi:hypothetical protein
VTVASGISWSNCSINIRSGDQATNYFKLDQLELRTSVEDLRVFKFLAERGYGAMLLSRYPSLRKYFSQFLQLPIAAERGSDGLLVVIELNRKLDRGDLTQLPADALSHISLLPNGTYLVDSPRRSATHKSGFRLRNGDGGNVPASHTTSP